MLLRVAVAGLLSLAVLVASVPAEDFPKALITPAAAPVPTKIDLPPKNFAQELPGGLKMEFVYIPGGEFEMGSPTDEKGRNANEGPRRTVTVKPYWLGKLEVKWEEFDLWKNNEKITEYPAKDPFPKVADALSRPTPTYEPEDYGHAHEGNPAICMSHHAAMMYCHWLRIVTKRGYRLPTEAEWEFACRAGSKGAYSFDVEQIGEYAQFKGNSPDEDHPKGTPAKCGSKKPNAFGLHDMHGNVAEWCVDHYADDYHTKTKAIQPVIVPTDKKWRHTVRGGSFKDQPEKLRSAWREGSDVPWMKHDPQSPRSIWWLTKKDEIGFRVCLPVEEQKELIGLKPMVVKLVDHDPVTEEK